MAETLEGREGEEALGPLRWELRGGILPGLECRRQTLPGGGRRVWAARPWAPCLRTPGRPDRHGAVSPVTLGRPPGSGALRGGGSTLRPLCPRHQRARRPLRTRLCGRSPACTRPSLCSARLRGQRLPEACAARQGLLSSPVVASPGQPLSTSEEASSLPVITLSLQTRSSLTGLGARSRRLGSVMVLP